MFPNAIKINKKGTTPVLRRVEHVRFPEVTRNEVLFAEQVKSLSNVPLNNSDVWWGWWRGDWGKKW